MENIEKISSTEYIKTVPQPDLVETKTLDDLLAEQASLEVGIQNNKDAIVFQQAQLDSVLVEIKSVTDLGIKPIAEVVQEVVEPVVEAPVDPLPSEIIN